MSATDIDALSCANCGEEDSNKLKKCSACLSVKYCSAACQKAHRPQHKKACKQRAAELYQLMSILYNEKLFEEVDPEECPICMLPMPIDIRFTTFASCCGKTICNGCIYSMMMSEGKDLCAFCRTPPPISEDEDIKRKRKLMDNGNGEAFHMFAGYYTQGINGLSRNYQKANKLFLKGGELGCASAYYNLGQSYREGIGVKVDMKKAQNYYELAAMGGSVKARNNLGCVENRAGNYERAYKHFMIAAKAGDKECLDTVKQGFTVGLVTKDEFASTLRSYHERQKEMKSDARDKAEASGLWWRKATAG